MRGVIIVSWREANAVSSAPSESAGDGAVQRTNRAVELPNSCYLPRRAAINDSISATARSTSSVDASGTVAMTASVTGSPLEVPGDLIRLSVGIEDCDDLLDDLRQALSDS